MGPDETGKNSGFWSGLLGSSGQQIGWDTGTKSHGVYAANGVYAVTVNVPPASTLNNVVTYPQMNWPWTAMGSGLGGQVTQTASGYNQMVYQQMMLHQTGAYQPQNVIYYQQPWGWDETAEEKAARLKRQAERKAAEQRAEHLLFTILTPSQVKQYTDDDYFELDVNSRLYRIRKGRSMNVELIEAGKPKIKYCAHPHDAFETPVPDVMLSQLLMLKANEAEFLRIANRTVLQ